MGTGAEEKTIGALEVSAQLWIKGGSRGDRGGGGDRCESERFEGSVAGKMPASFCK
jgi:hypothetical protein